MSETLESYCEYYKRPCTVSDGLCSECGERLIEPASGATEESPKTKGMTNGKQILEKAIQKAIDNGYKTRIPADVYAERILDPPHSAEQLIYKHDFAKALWPSGKCLCGESHNLGEVIMMKPGETTVHGQHKDWKYHLQQMVISPDPIKYLEEDL